MKRRNRSPSGETLVSLMVFLLFFCTTSLFAVEEECTWQTWIYSDSSEILFNQMTYSQNLIGPDKGADIINYYSSTLWTWTNDIDVYGDVMYVLNAHGLELYDIGDLANPVLIKRIYLGLGSQSDRLYVHQNTLYVAMYDKLYIFDITDPPNPVQLCLKILSGHISEIIFRDDRAYIGMIRYYGEQNNYPALYIYNISDPSNPQVVGKYESEAPLKDCRSFVLSGDYIYSINHWDWRIEIISIADEAHPQQVYMEEIIYPYDIVGEGNYLYVSNWDTLRAYDISDPDTLVQVHIAECDPDASALEAYQGLIYTVHGHNRDFGITVYDYYPGTGFDSVGHYDSWCRSHAIGFRDSTAFFPEGVTGFSILSLADPEQPQLIREVLHDISMLSGLDAEGDLVYMTNYMSFIGQPDYNGLVIVDVTDKTAPELVSRTDAQGNPLSVCLHDTLAIISECQPTNIFSVADPVNPVFLSQYPIEWAQTKDNAARDTILYMIGGAGCLETASIADPLNPYYISQLDGAQVHIGLDITLEGDIAYIMAVDFSPDMLWLRTVDVSNPANLVLLDEIQLVEAGYSYTFPGHSYKQGDILYVGAGYAGLKVIDISDNTDLEIIGEYVYMGLDIWGNYVPLMPIQAVDVKQNYLVASSKLSLMVFDVIDPTDPKLVQFIPISGGPGEIEIQGNYLYVASSRAMYVFEFDLPPLACGDANGDSFINVADAVYLINYIFKGGKPPDEPQAGDANGDGQVNVADPVFLINYVFKGGPAPDCP